jgi:hypothetical protein
MGVYLSHREAFFTAQYVEMTILDFDHPKNSCVSCTQNDSFRLLRHRTHRILIVDALLYQWPHLHVVIRDSGFSLGAPVSC